MPTTLHCSTASAPGRRLALGATVRALALTALVSLGFSQTSRAQTTLAQWPMATNNSSTAATGISSGAPTLADLVLPSSSSIQYTAIRGQSVSPVNDGGGWTGTALLRTRYEQFAVTAATGYAATVKTISLNTGVISTGNGRLGVSYSTDPTFAAFSEATAATLPGGGSGTGSFGSPVTLPNLSSGTGTSGTADATTAFSFQLNNATGVALTSGQTLYIRLYYNANSTSNSRYALLRNVVASGSVAATGPFCADPSAVSVGSITATTAQLSFTAGAGNTSYTVSYTPLGGSTTTLSPAPTASPVSLTGLTPSTDYTLTLQSSCSGNGGVGGVITTTFSTPAPPPCADPTGVSISNVTSSSAQLNFTAGTGNSSQTVTLTPQGGATQTQTVTTSPVAFSGLTAGTQYTATIRSSCSAGGTGSIITRTFTVPVANSTLLQEWPLTAGSADNAGTRSVGVTASSPSFFSLTSSTSGTVPAYSATIGQAFAPAADGGSWGNTSNLSTPRYQEYTVTATGSYAVRVDSLTFATGILSSSNGRLGVRYSLNGFATASEVNGWTLPAGVSTGANSGFANAFTGLRNLPVAPAGGSSLTTADTYHLALNGTTGVALLPGQTLTIRLYYAVGSGSAARYALLRDVKVKGQATFSAPVCNDPTGMLVDNVAFNTARLSFTPGAGNTSYTVTVTPAGGSSTTLTPTASPVSLTGLTPGTSYSLTLQGNCAGGLQTTVLSTSFRTASLPLQMWPLRVSAADTAALRSVAVLPSAATLRRFAASSAGTPDDFSGKYGHAFAPLAAGGGWNNMGTSGGAPSRRYYVQFTVTAANGYSAHIDSLRFNSTFYGSAAGRLALAYSLSGFTLDSTEIISFAAPLALNQQVTSPSSTPNTDAYSRLVNGGTGVTLAPGQTMTLRFYYGAGTSGSSGRFALLRDLFVNGSGMAVPTDLIVSSAQTIAGSYNNVTVTGTGTATLGGSTTINGSLTVQSGGSLITACQPLNGAGSFVLAPGATLSVCAPAGISSSGTTGAVQTTGSRSFSPDANYVYNGSSAQVSGSGLPATVRSLTVNNAAGLTLSQAVSITQLARLQSGNLNTGGQSFTLLSSASGTALVDNSGGVVSGTGTMQRAITNTAITSAAYRHFSSPVQSSTFADLTTPGFTPNVAQGAAYNSSATPGNVTPFPTVFGYDQARLASSPATALSAFDKGWLAPTSLSQPLQVTRGYTVNAPATAAPIDFVGTFNNGAQPSGSLSRGADAQAGWQLLGNPYPAPLDWSTVGAGQRPGMDAAMYVYESTGQYVGNYRSYVNGVGGASPLVDAGQGYFARVTLPNSTGSVNLTNANRVTTFDAQPVFGRGTADTRPQLNLLVRGAGLSDEAYLYFEAGATAAAESSFDAVKLANPTGLNLASLAGTTELAVNGLAPLAGSQDVIVPLNLRVPQAGSFTFETAALANLGSATVYLRDALSGTQQRLAAGTRYSFALATATAGSGRFALVFRPAAVTASQPTLDASQVSLYPNPAQARFTVLLPPVAGQKEVKATLLNSLGQVVSTRAIALTAAGATSEFDVRGLAPGIYALRLQAGAQLLTQRVVVE